MRPLIGKTLFSVVPPSNFLKGAVSAQKALQGSQTETRELLFRTEENSNSPMRGHGFALQANQWFFIERREKKDELVARTWVRTAAHCFHAAAVSQTGDEKDMRFRDVASWTVAVKDYRCHPRTCNFRVEGSEACDECLTKGTVSFNWIVQGDRASRVKRLPCRRKQIPCLGKFALWNTLSFLDFFFLLSVTQ